jgi:hypothetical protein
VTKFVGKFRKNQDYNDDYIYAKNYLHTKKRKGEHSEVKKQLQNWEEETLEQVDISQSEKY